MAPIPQLPFDLISKILQERKNIKKLEREKEENMELYDEVMNDFILAVNEVKMEEIKDVHRDENLTDQQIKNIFDTEDNADFIMDYVVGDGYNHLNNFLIV
jgi:hypothetical protein